MVRGTAAQTGWRGKSRVPTLHRDVRKIVSNRPRSGSREEPGAGGRRQGQGISLLRNMNTACSWTCDMRIYLLAQTSSWSCHSRRWCLLSSSSPLLTCRWGRPCFRPVRSTYRLAVYSCLRPSGCGWSRRMRRSRRTALSKRSCWDELISLRLVLLCTCSCSANRYASRCLISLTSCVFSVEPYTAVRAVLQNRSGLEVSRQEQH